jgi:nucleotide-binding universal stress UspA family protein
MFLKILAALDASERAHDVFSLAVGVARVFSARLYVVRAISIPPEFPPAAAGSPTDPLIARTARNAMQDLSRLVASAPDDISMQPPVVRLGPPWKVVLEIADERDIDLIIVGKHGYQGRNGVLGTTAGKIATVARRNVLIVHARERRTITMAKGSMESGDVTGRLEDDDLDPERLKRLRSMN